MVAICLMKQFIFRYESGGWHKTGGECTPPQPKTAAPVSLSCKSLRAKNISSCISIGEIHVR